MEASRNFPLPPDDERDVRFAGFSNAQEIYPELPDYHEESVRVAKEDAELELEEADLLNERIAQNQHVLEEVAKEAFTEVMDEVYPPSDIERDQYHGYQADKPKTD